MKSIVYNSGRIFSITILLLLILNSYQSNAQTSGASDNLVAQPVPDRTLWFDVSDSGVAKPMDFGLDLAWAWDVNFLRGIAFMGLEDVDIVRASFQPTLPLVNDSLQQQQIDDLNYRLSLIALTDSHTVVALNCDHPTVDPWYVGQPAHWAQLIDVTTRRVQEAGRTVVTVSPFNEPDYGWQQYDQDGKLDFYNICGELRSNPRFDSIRISGGNTLNCDVALEWYDYLKDRLDEGNTHQLAGNFDNFAEFFQTVRANGDHATGDEMHNVMEAMVGVEYGMQTGIWWGTAELARGEFVKASDGRRLGYAEHRPKWTAASVYRNPEGRIQAFGGTSERQAATTLYRFVSKDRDVFFDGYGPQREYTMTLPGGTGYQQGQTNAERVVNITWGYDIQPVIDGRYILVNRNSGLVMEVTDGSVSAGANVRQASNTGANYQQWDADPVDSRIGGDFSYFTITAAHSGKVMDINNWSLDDGGNLMVWDDTKGANQQWYLEYAEEGWFYIRNRQSAKCLEVADASTQERANIIQSERDGEENQQWRFIPAGTTIDFDPPAAPGNLVAAPNSESILLNWNASPETDLAGYTIFRSDEAGGPYFTIARNITTLAFVDNTATSGGPYYYRIKAVDNSLNRSVYSNEVSASATGNPDLTAHFPFDGNSRDSSVNLNHGAPYGGVSFAGNDDSQALWLNGTDAFIQLPAYLANQQEISIATWVQWSGGSRWQRIFDFGNGEDESLSLTAEVRFTIKKGGIEQSVEAPPLTLAEWSHIAVTLDASALRIFINGEPAAESDIITLSPLDFKPLLNYIGRSQSGIPYFYGYIDDFRVYNYALSASEVEQISAVPHAIVTDIDNRDQDIENSLTVWPVPAMDILYVNYSQEIYNQLSTLSLYDINGGIVHSKKIKFSNNTELKVSDLPSGIYLLKLTNEAVSITKKVIISH